MAVNVSDVSDKQEIVLSGDSGDDEQEQQSPSTKKDLFSRPLPRLPTNLLSFTPRRKMEEPETSGLLLFTPRNDAGKIVNPPQPPNTVFQVPEPKAKMAKIQNVLAYTQRPQPQSNKKIAAKQLLSFTPRPAHDEQEESPKASSQSDDDQPMNNEGIDDTAIFGEWERPDSKNKYLLARQVKNVCEVKFQNGVVILRKETLQAAGLAVSSEDFRSNDVNTLATTIYRFYNHVHKDLFRCIKIKMLAVQGVFKVIDYN